MTGRAPAPPRREEDPQTNCLSGDAQHYPPLAPSGDQHRCDGRTTQQYSLGAGRYVHRAGDTIALARKQAIDIDTAVRVAGAQTAGNKYRQNVNHATPDNW